MMLGIPELCCYEELAAIDPAFLDRLSNRFLGPVPVCLFQLECRNVFLCISLDLFLLLCRVYMTISCLDGFLDCVFLCSSVLPSAKPDGRDICSSVELEFGHFFLLSGWVDKCCASGI